MFQSKESQLSDSNETKDDDPLETREWLESLEAVVRCAGKERGRFLMKELDLHAQQLAIARPIAPYSSYRNTILLDDQPVYPGNVALEDRRLAARVGYSVKPADLRVRASDWGFRRTNSPTCSA